MLSRIEQHTFISDLLNSESICVDLGVNRGLFCHGLVTLTGGKVFGAEAVPALALSIPAHPRIAIRSVAIAEKTGQLRINVFVNRCASLLSPLDAEISEAGVSETIMVPTVSLSDFIASEHLDHIDLLKIDIEGSELGVFDTTPDDVWLRIDQVTVEFHDFIWPEQRGHVEQIKRRMTQLGFLVINFSLDNTDVLFVNRSSVGLSKFDLFWIKYVLVYWRGFLRRIGKGDL